MAQEKHFKVFHFLPDGHPPVFPGTTAEVKDVTIFLTTAGLSKWVKIPNHDLEIISTFNNGIPIEGFRKDGKELFVHVFCNEYMNPLKPMGMVVGQYIKFNLGKPHFIPEELNWIHTIPLAAPELSPAEKMFMYQLTQSMFWMIYMEFKLKRV